MAIQAGLLKADNWKQLIIALEPEAASIYCQSLHAKECALDTPISSSGSATAGSPSPSTGAPKYKPPGTYTHCSNHRIAMYPKALTNVL